MIDDEFWTYKTIGKSHKLAHSKNKLYAYRQQENSVMHSEYSVKRLQAVEAKCERHEYVCKELPELEGESCYNVWFTCIYQGQLALRSINGNECNKVWNYLDEILKNYPIKLSLCNLNFKNKIWLRLAKISLKKTCLLRNFLKIGL